MSTRVARRVAAVDRRRVCHVPCLSGKGHALPLHGGQHAARSSVQQRSINDQRSRAEVSSVHRRSFARPDVVQRWGIGHWALGNGHAALTQVEGTPANMEAKQAA